jgi:N-acetylglutamate synthase-like GNAT family acetyltransferase
MLKMQINKYTSVYRDDVTDLILNIQQKEFSIPIDLDAQPDLKQIEQFYQKGNGNFWVATIDNTVAGTIALLDISNRQVALRKMFVKAAYRGKEYGVGLALLHTVFAWAREKKLTDIFLGTAATLLAAHRFYEKNGFTEVEKITLPAAFPVMKVDTKFYKYMVGE